MPGLRFVALASLAASAAGVSDGLCVDAGPPRSCSGPSTAKALLRQLDADGYDNTQRPPCGNASQAGPMHVEVQFYLTQMNEVDQKQEQLSANGYLRWWWRDSRLAYAATSEGGCADVIKFSSARESSELWQPDLYVDNVVTTSNVERQLLEVSPDGGVWMSQQVTLRVQTPLLLGKLPYDRHVARITFASYSMDQSEMRVTARGGAIGEGRSGVGIIAAPGINHTVWYFTDMPDDASGFETPGNVESLLSWDYLSLEFGFARYPKYFFDQVMFPSVLFLLVSYVQFWVDPNAIPARAALATIPLLILRTMTNSVYRNLPEGSQQMWLGDFLMTATVLCSLAAAEFAAVNAFLMHERKSAAEHAGLLKARDTAERLKRRCKAEGISLLQLLAMCEPQKSEAGEVASVEDGAAPDAAASEARPSGRSQLSLRAMPTLDSLMGGKASDSDIGVRRQASQALKTYEVNECDLLFIKYAEQIFRDLTDNDEIGPRRVHSALKSFDIYMTRRETASVMSMFLRDDGETTPIDDMECRMNFSQFVFLLMRIDMYRSRYHRGEGLHELYKSFMGLPVSRQIDMCFRILYPLLIGATTAAFYLMLPLY